MKCRWIGDSVNEGYHKLRYKNVSGFIWYKKSLVLVVQAFNKVDVGQKVKVEGFVDYVY